MGVFNKLKLWYTCKTSGRMKEYEEYKALLVSCKSNIDCYTRLLRNAVQKLTNIQQTASADSKEYIDAKNEVHRWQETLAATKLSLKFIRPNSQQDIDYRN